MNKFSVRFSIIAATFVIGIIAVTGWFYYQDSQPNKIILPDSTWEPIFFKSIDNATNLGGFPELRNEKLAKSDIEIRVWRGFGVSPLEGVVLKRTNGQWKGFHLKESGGKAYSSDEIIVNDLNPPKSGWENFWKRLTNKEILILPDSSEVDCGHNGIDGGDYVVEFSQNKVYRTYRYALAYFPTGKCREAKIMEEIGDIIGEEFDSGVEECKRDEWFSCTKLRKADKEKLDNELKTKRISSE